MFDINAIISLGIFIIILIIALFIIAMSTSACGGRDVCGKKYCMIGIMMDSMNYLILAIKLLIIVEFGVIVMYLLDL